MKAMPRKWVSIKKAWPKRYKYVLVYLTSKDIDILCLDLKDVNNELVATWWDKLGLREKEFGLVTHWMLLPTQPGIRNVIK